MAKSKVRKSRWKGWSMFDTVVILFAVLACCVTLYPIWYVFVCSISDPQRVLAGEVTLLPLGFSLESYNMVLSNPSFWRSVLNSVIYVAAGSLFMLFNTIAMAYPLTRPNLKFRKLITYYLLIPMYFGGGMIPTFLVISKLGLYNSPLSLILPASYGIWNIILVRTFMASLPGELIDAALIDGADQIKTLWKIVVPLSKPVIAVIMIYTIVGIWNSWFGASIYTTRREIQPVQLYLRNLLETTSNILQTDLFKSLPAEMQERYIRMSMSANQIKYTAIVVVTFPILAVYPMFQKYFTKGIMLGSLKG